MFNIFITILAELRDKTKRYDSLYHKVIAKAFAFSAQYNNLEYLQKFSSELTYYANSNDIKGNNVIPFIESQYVRFETANKLNSFDIALYALSDATKHISRNNVPAVYHEKFLKAKYDLMKNNNYRLYAAILHNKLYDKYRQNKDLTPDMPLDQMKEVVLVEAIISPNVEESSYISSKAKIQNFLDLPGGNIPTRHELVRVLLERTSKNALVDFVRTAEFGTDPFAICDRFVKFQAAFNKQQYYTIFEKDLEVYAAIRVIERTCIHYTTIHLSELSDMISWMPKEQIEELIIDASRHSIIPGHINQEGYFVHLIPRGEQCLQPGLSHLNDKLRDIFDHFQRIKKNLPPNLATKIASTARGEEEVSDRSSRSIYSTNEQLQQRIQTIKERARKIKDEQIQRREEAEKRDAEKQAEREAEEIALREKEKKNKEERDRREHEYNFSYTEIKLIAHEIDVDVNTFLSEPTDDPENPEPAHTGTSKSEDLDWIKYKANQIKVMYVEKLRSQGSIVQEKMNKVKEERGTRRVLERLAFRNKYEANHLIDKEPEVIKKLVVRQIKARKKAFEEEMKVYDSLKAACEAASSSFEALQAEVAHKLEEERAATHKTQPAAPGMATRVQPAAPIQQPQPTPAAPVEEKKEEEQPKETVAPTPEPKKEETQPEKSNAYKPSFFGQNKQQQLPPAQPTSSSAYHPPSPGAYQPVKTNPQPAPSSNAYKPPTTGGAYVPKTQGPAPYKTPENRFGPGNSRGGSSFGVGQRGPPQQGGNYRDRDDNRGGNYRDRDDNRGGFSRGGRGGNRGGRGGNQGPKPDLASVYGSTKK
ncbi:hypothetical protein TRFO_11307 [Tritrichomonas foetus]|uniref:PCI domain-containing protein n=1 Tax=Tritrichomonas foetus TaxID=1144522 RepID=A0A1J4J4C3_9EUKA|nr:hypothetical protein TRFO_11307 [Tritrichomonas foetus]|eukprot:OHS94224.1 hypothetical protein TRFO_11307 [Tritrichomonas foetus]